MDKSEKSEVIGGELMASFVYLFRWIDDCELVWLLVEFNTNVYKKYIRCKIKAIIKK